MGAATSGCLTNGREENYLCHPCCQESGLGIPVTSEPYIASQDFQKQSREYGSGGSSSSTAGAFFTKCMVSRQETYCRMRIILISDVYRLDNLPSLKTLVDTESQLLPPENVVTVLPGDFLAPSLLSSLDAGYNMVKMLNSVPINMVCFGNHDGNDIPYQKLCHRIDEFKGTWLNSNMPSFEPDLPAHHIRELTSATGQLGAKKVGFLGFLIGGGKWKSMYRPEAFGGAHQDIVPVLDAVDEAVERLHAEHPDVDCIIPLTHQDMPEDRVMAASGAFPVILGGHDHEQCCETHGTGKCKGMLVKPGMDAEEAAIIDVVWENEHDTVPHVTVHFQSVKDYPPDPAMTDMMLKAYKPVRELESATLYVLEEGDELSSIDARFGDVTMASWLATAVRDILLSDCAVINSGTVRGNKEYEVSISYGDLKKECPFDSAVVVVEMPFHVLQEGVRASRGPWIEADLKGKRAECKSALQVDEGVQIVDHTPISVMFLQKQPDQIVSVAVDSYVLRRNEVFAAYCAKFPERVPPEDSGRPLLPLVVEYFCTGMWKKVIDMASRNVMSKSSLKKFRHSVTSQAEASIGIKSIRTGRQSESSVGSRGSGDDPDFDIEDYQPIVPTASEIATYENGCHRIFQLLDSNKDGIISADDLQRVVVEALGGQLSSRVVIGQLLQMVDEDLDGCISEEELRIAFLKLAPRE